MEPAFGEHKGSHMKRTIVVGGGQGAGQLVASLRQEGYDGEILMIGEEPQLPYQRPPLSKAYLLGELPVERLLVRPEKFYADQNIETRLGAKVTAIDPEAQTVTLEDGETLSYSDLVLATGSQVRRLALPGFDQEGVFYLRTMADVDGIRAALTPGKRLVIIGGGYIGLEVAAVARKLGLDVTVLEMEKRILARVTTPAMSAFYTKVHTDHGVVIKTEAAAAALSGDGQVTGVQCKTARKFRRTW
jgi:3-phenylpropionate/trans-cinnamate dioxygenase ferredoxin reductase subunit